ncbi:MAG: thioredoxin [Nanoarchaeota archaeon]|nr:thioredoxin [Nanoarchaeota archaeon]
MIDVNDGNFKEKVLGKSKDIPVVVDFWAGWCMPCKMLGPVIEEVAKENKDKFILAKMNVEENTVMPGVYGVMSIPSVKMFKNGEVTAEFVGTLPNESIQKWVDDNV